MEENTFIVYDIKKFIENKRRMTFAEKVIRIVPSHLHSLVKNKNLTKRIDLPLKIEDYYLIRDLQPDKNYPFKIGLYENQNKKVVAKVWVGKIKNLFYYNLIDEILISGIITRTLKRISINLPNIYRNLSFPSFVGVVEGKGMLILLTEYIDGNPISCIDNDNKKFEIYQKCKLYLKFIGRSLTKRDRELIKKKTITDFVIQYPLVFLASLVKHIEFSPLLIRSIKTFLKGIVYLIKRKNIVLVHGDLNFDNVYLTNEKVYILDSEQMMFTYPEYEDITTISSARISEDFTNRILNNIFIKCKRNIPFALSFSSLLVNCQTQNLTGNVSKENLRNYINKLFLGTMISKSFLKRSNKNFNIGNFDLVKGV